jgi:hypothetical protein
MRATLITVTTLTLLLAPAAVASADPEAPQPGTPCAADFSDTMTRPADSRWALVCLANQWQPVTTPQPPNDRWLSFGPPITLHGQGQRNPDVASGNWTATPQDPDTSCRAEQRAVVEAGVVGAPQVSEAPAGQPLSFQVVPRLFSIELSGYCLWTRTGS